MANFAPPRQSQNEELVDVACRAAREFEARIDPERRKSKGQVFTPAEVAVFMAGMLDSIPDDFHVLDPGAGVGALTAAVCQRILSLKRPRHLNVTIVESDEAVLPYLEQTLSHCRRALRNRDHKFTFDIVADDFLLAVATHRNAQTLLFDDRRRLSEFDAVIVNPPYFKLPPTCFVPEARSWPSRRVASATACISANSAAGSSSA
jgi:adenine-specific DNA-methyltransferase